MSIRSVPFAGFLKAVSRKTSLTGEVLYEVALPNREIRAVYSSEIISRLGGTLSDSLSMAFSGKNVEVTVGDPEQKSP